MHDVSVDRREFMLASLMAAVSAAGARIVHAQTAPVTAGAVQQAQQTPPVPLGNGEPPALTFQAYPGGTGALYEKLIAERGAAAFARAPFTVEPWTGPVPPSDDDIAFLPAHRLSALIRERKLTSVRLTDIYLARMKRLDPVLQCAVTIMEEQARAEARQADAEIAAGRYRGPLHGLPYGIKDLFSTRGVPTSWGARDFATRVIDEDAEIVVRLREAGAVLMAKLATGLFANNDWWYRGRTNNPWDVRRGSSGSSAGPASATAGGCVAFGIGTETSGSIVSPARECGLSALRPTFGRVSRHGGMTLSWSRDRVGPLARTVEDCAMVFNVLHGADPKDPSTLTTPFQFDRNLDLAKVRIGYDEAAPVAVIEALRALGANPRPIGARPRVQGAGSGGGEGAAAFDFYVQMLAEELKVNIAELPPAPPAAERGRPGDPSKLESLRSRASQRNATAFDFIQGQRRRLILMQRMAEFMQDIDVYVQPENGGGDIGLHAQTGHPCVVFPYKFEAPTGPVGGAVWSADVQRPPDGTQYNPKPICAVMAGNLFADDILLGVAHAFQKNSDWHLKRPTLS